MRFFKSTLGNLTSTTKLVAQCLGRMLYPSCSLLSHLSRLPLVNQQPLSSSGFFPNVACLQTQLLLLRIFATWSEGRGRGVQALCGCNRRRLVGVGWLFDRLSPFGCVVGVGGRGAPVLAVANTCDVAPVLGVVVFRHCDCGRCGLGCVFGFVPGQVDCRVSTVVWLVCGRGYTYMYS
jgi:hypothetical protein